MADKQDQGKAGENNDQFEAAAARAGETATRAARGTSETLQQTARGVGDTVRHSTEARGRVARDGVTAAADSAGHLLTSSVGEFGEQGRRIADTAERMMDDLQALMRLPTMAGESFQDLQHAASRAIGRAVHANTRTAQDVFRLAGPGALLSMQQRVLQQYVEGLVETSSEVLRATRTLTERALKPLEEYQRETERRGDAHRGRQAQNGKVADAMMTEVEIARPDQSVQEVARLMAEADTGALPVGENDRLIGMITDRDIAVRVAAAGKDPKQVRVREVMTPEVRYCYEDEDLQHVAGNMAEQQVRRLPVMNRKKRLVGILSLGDLGTAAPPHAAKTALRGVSQPGMRHRQQAAYAGQKPLRSE